MSRKLTYNALVAFTLALIFFAGQLLAQDNESKERTRLTLKYEKLNNNDKKLTVGLIAGRGKNMVQIEGAKVQLTVSANDSTIDLAELTTDENGAAELLIKSGYKLITDKDGFSTLNAAYAGNDKYRKSGSEITVKDLLLDMTTGLVDSVKTVNVEAYELNSAGEKIPVEGLDINVGVQRLYSILQIGQIKTDPEGKGSIEFPDGLPGDSTGTLNLVARVDDNESYGTVNTRKAMLWGTPVSFVLKPLPRQLWSNEAPLWMIISVFIVLSAARFHFVMAVIRIVRVKKAAGSTTNMT